MKKAAHVVIWIFFIVLPFIKSSSTLDPVLLPRFMFISCTLLALLGTLFFSKEKLLFPKIPVHFTVGLIGFVVVSLAGYFYAQNQYEALFTGSKWTVLALWFITIVALLKSNLLDKEVLVKAIAVSGLIFATLSLLQLAGIDITSTSSSGVKGSLANKNLAASFMCMVFPLGMWLYKIKNNWFGVTLIILSTIVIGFTESRTAYLVYIIEAVLGYYLLFVNQHQTKLKWIVPVLFAFISGIALFAYYKLDESHFRNLYSSNTLKLRTKLWSNSVEMVKEYPVLGVGSGNWKLYFPKYGLETLQDAAQQGSVSYVRPHNDYFWIVTENGLVGFALFLIWFISVGWIGLKRLKKNDNEVNNFVFIGWLGYALSGLLDFPSERITHLALMFAFSAIIMVEKRDSVNINKLGLGGVGLLIVLFMQVIFGRIEGEKYSREQQYVYMSRDSKKLLTFVKRPNPGFYNLDPTVVPIDFFKAMGYASSNNFVEAIKYFKLALEAHPNHMLTHNNLGTMYRNNKQYDEAIKHFKAASAISPGYIRAKYNLVDAYVQKKDFKSAVKTFNDVENRITEQDYKYIKKVLLKGILSYLLDKHPELYKDQAYVRFVKNYKKFETMYDQCVEKDYWILQRALPFKADSLGNKL